MSDDGIIHKVSKELKVAEDFDLNSKVFKNNRNFYYYKGTMTQPPSVDFVHWFILKDVLPLREGLQYHHDNWLDDHVGFTNFRVTQPLYGRRVYRTWL